MIKRYLAGFGNPPTGDVLSSCNGYFLALRDEGFLSGKIITGVGSGWVSAGKENYFEAFRSRYGNDIRLWEMLTTRAKKRNIDFFHIIRAEINDNGKISKRADSTSTHRRALSKRLISLSINYPTLEFFVYPSDIEAKS